MTTPTLTRTRKVLLGLLAFVFFLVSVLFFSYLVFPYDRVRDFLVTRAQEVMPGAQIDIVSLQPAWFSGVVAEGVRVRLPSAPGSLTAATGALATGQTPAAVVRQVSFRQIYARVSILPLLWGNTEVTFEIEPDVGGSFRGVARMSETSFAINAEFQGFDLRALSAAQAFLPLPAIEGRLTGRIDLAVEGEQNTASGTGIDLTIARGSIGDGVTPVTISTALGPLSLAPPRMDVGNIALRGTVENGSLRITTMHGAGDDLTLDGIGNIRLLRQVMLSTADITLRFAIRDEYWQRSDQTRTISSLIEGNPMARIFRAADGAFQFRLQGPLVRMRPAPAPTAQFTSAD